MDGIVPGRGARRLLARICSPELAGCVHERRSISGTQWQASYTVAFPNLGLRLNRTLSA